ncbi:MAG TPA: glycosyltransferase [Woeseiaceae bacterium]
MSRRIGEVRAERQAAGAARADGACTSTRLVTQRQAVQYRVCIVYPADPMGVIPGGIDTFIKGVLRWAPPDLHFDLVGITTDPAKAPPGRWTTYSLHPERRFGFYPVLALRNSERQSAVPVALRFLVALLRRRVRTTSDVLEFHRIEPWLAFARDPRPKNLVMHQNMQDLRNLGSDIRWRHFPSLYFRLEEYILPRLSTVFCVREDATKAYQARFPAMRERIRFTPTWMDPDIFHLPDDLTRMRARAALNQRLGFPDEAFVLVTVGRLDRQKNPLLLLEAFRLLHEDIPELRLLFIGDGVLRPELEERIRSAGLQSHVKLIGVQPPPAIAEHLQASDLFVLSSAYEGMPIVVLEALATGLPVAATDVGEVSRAVHPGVNGELVSRHDPASLAAAIRTCRDAIGRLRGKPCADAVQPFTPQEVLKPIYANYRRLGRLGSGERPRRSVT